MKWVCLPAPALYVRLTPPALLSGLVTLLARLSPSGKLIVDVAGLALGSGVSEA
jgi:hypothetical protein